MAPSNKSKAPAGNKRKKASSRTSKSRNVPSPIEADSNTSIETDLLASDYESHEELFDENDDDRSLSFEIQEEEERVRSLIAENDSLSQKLADRQKLMELRKQRELLELAVLDVKRKLLTSDLSSRSRELEVMSPINLSVQGSRGSVGVAPTAKTGTLFLNDDGIEFFAMDKKSAAEKIRKCLPFGRALDLERKKLLLGDEGIEYNQKTIKDKLIGFSSRTKADLMSTGADTSKFTIAPTWLSTKKLTDDAILNLPILKNLEKFDLLLRFQFAFRDYTVISLDDFVKGGFLDDSDHALLRATLTRTQEVMAGVFGNSFNKVFDCYIDAIQDDHHSYDGEFLRFLAEEVLYRYGQHMSEPWNEGLKLFYKLDDLHSPGNAALLLTFMFDNTKPSKTNEQEFRIKESKSLITINKSNKIISSPSSQSNPVDSSKLKKAAKNKLRKAKKVLGPATFTPSPKQTTSEVFCLIHLMNALKISTTDCHFGLGCRNSHREPNKANKSEFQKIIGSKSHHGSANVKSDIHDALNLL
jgi:hypothetical protein